MVWDDPFGESNS